MGSGEYALYPRATNKNIYIWPVNYIFAPYVLGGGVYFRRKFNVLIVVTFSWPPLACHPKSGMCLLIALSDSAIAPAIPLEPISVDGSKVSLSVSSTYTVSRPFPYMIGPGNSARPSLNSGPKFIRPPRNPRRAMAQRRHCMGDTKDGSFYGRVVTPRKSPRVYCKRRKESPLVN